MVCVKNNIFTLQVPPSITGGNVVNITVLENTPVTMECDVEAFPPPTITWFKNARPLLLRPGLRLSQNDRQLGITWTQVSQSVRVFALNHFKHCLRFLITWIGLVVT